MDGYILCDSHYADPSVSKDPSEDTHTVTNTSELDKIKEENMKLKEENDRLKKQLQQALADLKRNEFKTFEDGLMTSHQALIDKRENDQIQADYEKYLLKEHKAILREKEGELSDAKEKVVSLESELQKVTHDFAEYKTHMDVSCQSKDTQLREKEEEQKNRKPITLYVHTILDNTTLETKIHSIGVEIGNDHVGRFSSTGNCERDYEVLQKGEPCITVLHCDALGIPNSDEYPSFHTPIICNKFLPKEK